MQNLLRRLFLDVLGLHILGVRNGMGTTTKLWDSLWSNKLWECWIESLGVSYLTTFFFFLISF